MTMNQNWTEVERLVRLAQEGDRRSFGELAERFEPTVLAVARRYRRDVHEAAELVQDVFLHAMRKIGQLREPACFGAWLRRMAARVAINQATRRPPMALAELEVLEQYGQRPEDSPLDSVLRNERRDQVRAALARLKPMDREALVAFYLKGRPLAVIAQQLEVPVGTIKRRLHVARKRLESILLGDEVPATGPKRRRVKELELCEV